MLLAEIFNLISPQENPHKNTVETAKIESFCMIFIKFNMLSFLEND